MSRASRRRAFTLPEILIAAGVTSLAIVLLWAALHMVLRGAGRAEWQARSERGFEELSHLLEQEVRRANHLVTTEPGGRRVHDPRFSALWISEADTALRFRVFAPDQSVASPTGYDLESIRQDRVGFLLREGKIVFIRRGDLEEEETRVVIEDVAAATFSPGAPYEDRGALGGLLKLKLELRQKGGAAKMVRELTFPAGVPVLRPEEAPEDRQLLPPPQAGNSP